MATVVDDEKYIRVEDHYIRPSAEWPDGSYMQKIGGKVIVATGHYSKLYPDKASLDWHGKPPFSMLHLDSWPWEAGKK